MDPTSQSLLGIVAEASRDILVNHRPQGGGIFVSYRRQETSHFAGRLCDRLARDFRENLVFIDVDAIRPGTDFLQAIGEGLWTSDVLLAIIGPQWLTAKDQRGRRRIDDPSDIVQLEIRTALYMKMRIIPILVDDAVMPREWDLPERLAELARLNPFVVRHP
jgi:hypothetical protein